MAQRAAGPASARACQSAPARNPRVQQHAARCRRSRTSAPEVEALSRHPRLEVGDAVQEQRAAVGERAGEHVVDQRRALAAASESILPRARAAAGGGRPPRSTPPRAGAGLDVAPAAGRQAHAWWRSPRASTAPPGDHPHVERQRPARRRGPVREAARGPQAQAAVAALRRRSPAAGRRHGASRGARGRSPRSRDARPPRGASASAARASGGRAALSAAPPRRDPVVLGVARDAPQQPPVEVDDRDVVLGGAPRGARDGAAVGREDGLGLVARVLVTRRSRRVRRVHDVEVAAAVGAAGEDDRATGRRPVGRPVVHPVAGQAPQVPAAGVDREDLGACRGGADEGDRRSAATRPGRGRRRRRR